MKSEQYWSKRLETLNESQLQKGEKYIKTMNTQYNRAMALIQKDIDTFYHRFAKNNGVDLHTAQQLLNGKQLKELHWTLDEYIQKGRENAIDQRWMKELENASIQVRMSRLDALKIQMRQHIEVLTAAKQAGTHELLGGIYKDNYYKSIFELNKGAGLGSSFAKLDKRQTEILLSTPWSPDGTNFSSKIWRDRTQLVHELQTVLTQGLIRGETSHDMTNNLMIRMDVSRSVAARLVITESAYFSGQSRLKAYEELGVEEYKYVSTLDLRTSSICRSMDGKVFMINEAKTGVNYPPLHAHCRSTTIPHYDNNVRERAAQRENGDTYDVPGDMVYEEWYNKYVGTPHEYKYISPPDEPKQEVPHLVEKVEPRTPTVVRQQLLKYENSIRNMPIEHAYIGTTAGEIFYTAGTEAAVQIGGLGANKLKNAIITHNHPTIAGEAGGSFSKDDVLSFFGFGLMELRAVDQSHNYKLSKSPHTPLLNANAIGLLYLEAEQMYGEKLTIEMALRGYDSKHLTMVELVTLIEGLQYERSPYNGS